MGKDRQGRRLGRRCGSCRFGWLVLSEKATVKLIWATDLHLDHCQTEARSRLIESIANHSIDGLLLTGDISEADDLEPSLVELSSRLQRPVHFVLGNHDFYGGSIARTRQTINDLVRRDANLRYLTGTYEYRLTGGVFLIGEDGWGDATLGDYEGSYVRLKDFEHIEDFSSINTDAWKARLNDLGRESAERLGDKLERLPSDAKHVLVLTHVPPFRESCWYEGHTTDDNWSPFFVCGEIGKRLQHAAQVNPEIKFTVLCGHTHHDGVSQMSDNLIVYTGASVYGSPEIEAIVNVREDGIAVERVHS